MDPNNEEGKMSPARWDVWLNEGSPCSDLMGSTSDKKFALQIAEGVMRESRVGEDGVSITRQEGDGEYKIFSVGEVREMAK